MKGSSMKKIFIILTLILTTHNLFAKENHTCYHFNQIDLILNVAGLYANKDDERSVNYYLKSNREYTGSLWCYPKKKEIYHCQDSDGNFKIKMNAQGVFIYPQYIIVGKVLMINGEPDLDRIIIKQKKYIEGKSTTCSK